MLRRILIAGLCIIAVMQPAWAMLTRNGTYAEFGTSDNQRYLNLANQSRFDTVGNIQLYQPSPVLGGGTGAFAFQNNCTGTLITPSIILTAAHCFSDGSGHVEGFQQSGGRSSMPLASGAQVFFAGGSNLATDYRYSTPNIDYAVQVDRLSIHPDFNLSAGDSITFGSDIALLRVYSAPWLGSLPTSFIPINTSDAEATIPNDGYLDGDFAITIGYGWIGDGILGITDTNIAVEKRAGLTEVDFDASHPDTLTSVFMSPRNYSSPNMLWPSNFLQAAPGPGDSGGPLIRNYGSGDVIIGVVQGGGNFYGERNWWTRTSTFADWIANEALALGSAPVTAVPGATAQDALAPQQTFVIDALTTLKQFSFFGGSLAPIFLDPELSDGVEIKVNSGPNVASIILSDLLAQPASLWLYDEATQEYVAAGVTLQPGERYDFVTAVTRFQLRELSGQAGQLSLGFLFDGTGSVQLDWVATTAVPAPPAVWLAFTSLGAAGWFSRKRRPTMRKDQA